MNPANVERYRRDKIPLNHRCAFWVPASDFNALALALAQSEEANAALRAELSKAREVEDNVRRAIADREFYLGDSSTSRGNRKEYQRELGWLKCFIPPSPPSGVSGAGGSDGSC